MTLFDNQDAANSLGEGIKTSDEGLRMSCSLKGSQGTDVFSQLAKALPTPMHPDLLASDNSNPSPSNNGFNLG